jgi:hypothetical protein
MMVDALSPKRESKSMIPYVRQPSPKRESKSMIPYVRQPSSKSESKRKIPGILLLLSLLGED